MTGIDFLEKMNDIDYDLLEAANRIPAKKRKLCWQIYLPLVATIILLIGLGFMTSHDKPQVAENNTLVAFYYNDVKFEMPSLNDYVELGKAGQDADSRSAVSIEKITEKDLGEKLGEIVISTEHGDMNCVLYRYAAKPDMKNVCILEFPGGDYQMYIAKDE